MQDIHNVRGAEPVHLDEPLKQNIKKLPQEASVSKTPAHIPSRNINKTPGKKSILLLWILSTITCGLWPSIWYLKKVPEFYNLGTRKKFSKNLPITLLIIGVLEIITIIIIPFTITSKIGTFYQNLSTLQTSLLLWVGIAILLRIFFTILLAFYSREIINQALEQKETQKKISWFFTLIFGFLYLQYEINRILEDKEEAPKKGPWIFLILYILVIVLGVVSSFI